MWNVIQLQFSFWLPWMNLIDHYKSNKISTSKTIVGRALFKNIGLEFQKRQKFPTTTELTNKKTVGGDEKLFLFEI